MQKEKKLTATQDAIIGVRIAVYDPGLFLGDVHYVDTTLTLVLVTEFIKAGF